MKKAIAIISVFALLAFSTEKFITVKFTEPQINYHWQTLNQIKQIVDQSSLPHNQVVFIVQSIDSLQKNIQLTAKLDSLTSKK
jgi:hypothetical protein